MVNIYKHQKLAIGLNIIPTILKTACIIFSFNSNDSRIYTEYPWWTCIGIISYFFFIAISAFINCTIKSFLDLKYSTTSQILMFYTSIGIFVYFLMSIIGCFVPCSKIDDEYFSSFANESSIDKFIREFIIILYSITYFFQKYFFILVIKYTDPVNFTFSSIIKKIVLISNNLIVDQECFKDTSNYKVAKYFLDISGDIICLFGYLIYLENIELNFYNLNYT